MKLDANTLFFSLFINVTLMFVALCVGVRWKDSSGASVNPRTRN